jgi:hypothetical protein
LLVADVDVGAALTAGLVCVEVLLLGDGLLVLFLAKRVLLVVDAPSSLCVAAVLLLPVPLPV